MRAAPAAPGRHEPAALRMLSRGIGALTTFAIGCSAAAVLVSLVLIGWSVVMRYVFNQAPVWVDDMVGFLLVAIVMLSAAQALRRGEHIGVDLLAERLSARAARWTQAWALFAVLLVALILVVNGWQTAMQSRQFGVVTEGRLEWPVWMLMMLMPVGGALMTVVALEGLWRLALGLHPADSGSAHGPPGVPVDGGV